MDRRSFIAKILGLIAALGWAGTQPAAARRQASNKPSRDFDIAIIGAGLFGSAAARHLSETNDGVALIGPAEPQQRRNHQGIFASHYDASRLVRGIDPDLTWATLAKRSIDRYRSIEKASDISFYHDIGYMMVTPGGLGENWFNKIIREHFLELNISLKKSTIFQTNPKMQS